MSETERCCQGERASPSCTRHRFFGLPYHRRPTTDDGRRTTDDRRPTTKDRRPATTQYSPTTRSFVGGVSLPPPSRARPSPERPQRVATSRHVTVRLRGSTRRADELVRVVRNDEATHSSPRRSEHTNDWSFRPTGSFQTILLSHIVHCRHTVIPHPSTRPSRRTNGRIQRGNSTSWNPFPGS